MFKSEKITKIREELNLDLQLIACELDTSVMYMKYVSKDLFNDSIDAETFDKLFNKIEKNGVSITQFDDDTSLYEYKNEAIILHKNLNCKFLIFDLDIEDKIEFIFKSIKRK